MMILNSVSPSSFMQKSGDTTMITSKALNTQYKNGSVPMTKKKPHTIVVPRGFVTLIFFVSILLAFSTGRMARILFLGRQASLSPTCTNCTEHFQPRAPATCQQLVADMNGIHADFLMSEERLAKVLVSVVWQSTKTTALNHYCHRTTEGLVCMGVFPDGKATFRTWPREGVIALDVMLCGGHNRPNVLDTVKEVFGEANVVADADIQPEIRWSIKKRGYRDEDFDVTDLEDELETPGRPVREMIASVESPFQHIDIVAELDVAATRLSDYKKSLAGDDSYYSLNPDFFRPSKSVYLHGVLQSTAHGDAAYHEALVHPAMFAHDNPERVAIIGGGEGATLREVLKHATVKEAIMVEIDEQMISVSREYLPEWNSCDNLVGSTESCFDEPRAQVYTEDAIAWFIDRFYTGEDEKANAEGLENAEPMDVIIMDALDPQDFVEFCDALYNNKFLQSLFNGLSNEGVLIMQLGEAPSGENDPPDSVSINHRRADITDDLEEVGFQSIHVYEESHCDFEAPWTYLVAFKDYESRANWYANEAEIELKIHDRAMRTKTGGSPFLHFDGSTMVSYQTPHKSFESVFCKEDPVPESCTSMRGFDPYRPNVPTSLFQVKRSQAGENAGRGVFAKVEIPDGAYIGLEHSGYSLDFHPATHELITGFQKHEVGEAMTAFGVYVPGYGTETEVKGDTSSSVDSSILTFINHGCNGTYNAGWKQDAAVRLTEFSVQRDLYAFEDWEDSMYDPVADRHHRHVYSGCDKTLRKINAGEELLINYLTLGAEEDWEEDVRALQMQCSGEGVGEVTAYKEMCNA